MQREPKLWHLLLIWASAILLLDGILLMQMRSEAKKPNPRSAELVKIAENEEAQASACKGRIKVLQWSLNLAEEAETAASKYYSDTMAASSGRLTAAYMDARDRLQKADAELDRKRAELRASEEERDEHHERAQEALRENMNLEP